MPTTNARGHVIPSGTETSFNRATIFETWGNSIRDIPAVANVSARAQLVSDLTLKGQAPSTTKPLYVWRADAPGLHKIEYTDNGTVWVPTSGVLQFVDKAAADSWGSSNGGRLTVGDECSVGGVRHTWTGTAWVAIATHLSLVKTAAQSSPTSGQPTGTATDVLFTGARVNRGFTLPAFPAAGFALPASGDYEISASGTASQTGGNYFNLALVLNGVTLMQQTGSVYPHTPAYSFAAITPLIVAGTAGHIVKLVGTTSSAGQFEANSFTLNIRRLG